MESKMFPRTTVAGVSLSRMIIGTNWMLGWSHTSPAADHQIKARFHDGQSAVPMLEVFLNHGVDTMMGMLQQEQVMRDAVKAAEDKTGKKLIVIDTPGKKLSHLIKPTVLFECSLSNSTISKIPPQSSPLLFSFTGSFSYVSMSISIISDLVLLLTFKPFSFAISFNCSSVNDSNFSLI